RKPVAATVTPETTSPTHPGMVYLKGGDFAMGSNDDMPDEAPVHQVTVKPFWIDAKEVAVADFVLFVTATHYQTEAEKFGWSGVFNVKSGKWEKVNGASWRHPDGPQSNPNPTEPVCQVSWNDAVAYAMWRGKRLPTEAEWEYAARGGLVGKKYA